MRPEKSHYLNSRFSALLSVSPNRNTCRTLALIACLSIALFGSEKNYAKENTDPLMGLNRPIHEFNTVVDSVLVRPLASGYSKFAPKFVKI